MFPYYFFELDMLRHDILILGILKFYILSYPLSFLEQICQFKPYKMHVILQ
jgi:hypothetical protein